METVYKVVRVDESSGKKYSCMHWQGTPDKRYLDTGVILEYTQGRITKPKFGKILAFNNLTDASAFAGAERVNEVWKCTTPRFKPVIRLAHVGEPVTHMILYWKGRLYEMSTIAAPLSTVACPQICLKELMIRND